MPSIRLTIISPMGNLPFTQPQLKGHTDEPCNAYTTRVTHTCRTQTKLAIFPGHVVGDLRKCRDIDEAAKESFPKNDDTHHVEVWEKVEHGCENKSMGCCLHVEMRFCLPCKVRRIKLPTCRKDGR